MKATRLERLPAELRQHLKQARLQRRWSQRELGKRTGLPQQYISTLEAGKIVPRYDTLLDLVRVLGQDLVLVPRELVPAIQSLCREYGRSEQTGKSGAAARPLYAEDTEEEPS